LKNVANSIVRSEFECSVIVAENRITNLHGNENKCLRLKIIPGGAIRVKKVCNPSCIAREATVHQTSMQIFALGLGAAKHPSPHLKYANSHAEQSKSSAVNCGGEQV
jgi:hypothetical protein